MQSGSAMANCAHIGRFLCISECSMTRDNAFSYLDLVRESVERLRERSRGRKLCSNCARITTKHFSSKKYDPYGDYQSAVDKVNQLLEV
ncbi:hypothetical protein LCGC14_2592950 [marine sediment metagenome]|uniref:Uncharacterized protein n=1 Tax=marine sediment metagenome TaxID=412755 RepID=A0A0F9ABE2_9ZZZZ